MNSYGKGGAQSNQEVDKLLISDIINKTNKIDHIKTHKGIAWFSENARLAYVSVPKCASSSIRDSLGLKANSRVSDLDGDFYKFTTIREPVSRFVSAFIEVTEDGMYKGGRFRYDPLLPEEKKQFLSDMMQNYGEIDRFKIFFNKIACEWGFCEEHCIPQVVFLTDEDQRPLENIEIYSINDIKKLETKLNKRLRRSNDSHNPRLKKKLINYINDNISFKNEICDLYSEDMKLWSNYND